MTEVDGHKFIKSAPKLAWEQPFAPYVPRQTTRDKEKAARKERERRQAEGLPAATPKPAEPEAATSPLKPRLPDHYIMNLPDSALSFLPAFASSFTPLLEVESFKQTYPAEADVPMPMIHVYCFTREMEFAGAQIDVLEVRTLLMLVWVRIADCGRSAQAATSVMPLRRIPRGTIFIWCGASRQTRRCTVSRSVYLAKWPSSPRRVDRSVGRAFQSQPKSKYHALLQYTDVRARSTYQV